MRAIQINEFGGPEVLKLVHLPDPQAGPGELLVHVDSAGINFADTHAVEDSYLQKSSLPMIPGRRSWLRADWTAKMIASPASICKGTRIIMARACQ